MYRTTGFLVLGFFLFFFGFIALILMLVGLQISFLSWIDQWGRTGGLVIRLLMVFGGLVLMYLMRSKFEQ